MSKSLDNYIGIDESPEIMYEKAMKIPDDCLLEYFKLTTDVELEDAKQWITDDIVLAHRKYAEEIIKMYHGENRIKEAEERYKQVAKGKIPDNIKEINISNETREINICDLLVKTGFAPSKSEAKRMIQGKGVKINSNIVDNLGESIVLEEPIVLQFGKNKFIKVV